MYASPCEGLSQPGCRVQIRARQLRREDVRALCRGAVGVVHISDLDLMGEAACTVNINKGETSKHTGKRR